MNDTWKPKPLGGRLTKKDLVLVGLIALKRNHVLTGGLLTDEQIKRYAKQKGASPLFKVDEHE